MGKGDRRTRRGKIFQNSFGVSRKHESRDVKPVKKPVVAAKAPAKTAKAAKSA